MKLSLYLLPHPFSSPILFHALPPYLFLPLTVYFSLSPSLLFPFLCPFSIDTLSYFFSFLIQSLHIALICTFAAVFISIFSILITSSPSPVCIVLNLISCFPYSNYVGVLSLLLQEKSFLLPPLGYLLIEIAMRFWLKWFQRSVLSLLRPLRA